MAVKGRLRFEILRRDNHTCRYCGATSSDEGVKLTVDHVVPESLGGGDDPANLVTACMSCNAGKASIAPDSTLVADVAADAVRYSLALQAATAERARNFGELQDQIDEFDGSWCAWGWGEGDERKEVPRSLDWRQTVERWLQAGVDLTELTSKIPIAMKRGTKGDEGRWSYLCGIGWGMLTELQDRARELAALDTDPDDAAVGLGEIALAGWRCERCTVLNLPTLCDSCAYDDGFSDGRRSEASWERRQENVRLTARLLEGAVLV